MPKKEPHNFVRKRKSTPFPLGRRAKTQFRERQQDDLFGNDDDGYGKARQKAPVKELGDPAL